MNVFVMIYSMAQLILFIIGMIIVALIPVCITVLNTITIIKKVEYTKRNLIFNIIGLLVCFLCTYVGFMGGYIRSGLNNQSVYLDYNCTTVITGD